MGPAAPSSDAVAPARALAYDAATIKPVGADGHPTHGRIGVQYHPDSMEAAWLNLSELLCYAYGCGSLRFEGQVTGVPGWAVTQKYDIVAKMSDADSEEFETLSKDEQKHWREAMLQALLAERFHLTLHKGSKEIPIFEMVAAKGGTKMIETATDPNPPHLEKDGKPSRGLHFLKDTSVAQAYSMDSLADVLSIPAAQVGRPVVDKTGLTSTYDFTLDWSIYLASAAANNEATSIFTALGKIGLKLQPSTADKETIVINHVEPPLAN